MSVLIKVNEVLVMCRLTLMADPLALFDEVWLGGQRHEVALDDVAGMLLTEEEWRLPRALVALVGLLIDLDRACSHRW